MKATINEQFFKSKVKTCKEAGLTHYRIIENGPEWDEAIESGFMDWMLKNYEHETHHCGTVFVFDLLNPIKL
jgi:uncharacterized protein YqkB